MPYHVWHIRTPVFSLYFPEYPDRLRGPPGNVDMVEWDDSGSISVDELEMLLETVG